MEKPFKDVVEGASDRRVLAYMSQIHTSPDIAVELFVLEPQEAPVVGEHREEIGAPGGALIGLVSSAPVRSSATLPLRARLTKSNRGAAADNSQRDRK